MLLTVPHFQVQSTAKSRDSIHKIKAAPFPLSSPDSGPLISLWVWDHLLPVSISIFTCYTSDQVTPLLRTFQFIQENYPLPLYFLLFPPKFSSPIPASIQSSVNVLYS